MSPSTSIFDDQVGTHVNATLYHGVIISMFTTILCARYQATLNESHLLAIKRIFHYLKHTPNLGLWYPHDSKFKLVGFIDCDHGGAQMLGNRLVSWSSKKHTLVACSTAKAKS